MTGFRETAGRQRLERFSFDVNVSMFRDSLNMFLDLLRIRWNGLRGRYRQASIR